MKKKLLVVGLCAVMLTLSGCGKAPKLKSGEEVAASVDGKKFTADELYKEMKQYYGTAILVDLIDNYIIEKEVKDSKEAETYADSQVKTLKAQYEASGMSFEDALINAGFENEKAYKEYVALEYKKSTIADDFIANELTEEEIKKYYDDEIFGEITAKHILISPEVADNATDEEKTAAEKKAKEEAEALIKKIQAGEDFDTLAKENSDDKGTASEGGKLTFTKDKVVSEFWTAASSLKDGDYTAEPVKSTYGYHIILRVSQKERPKLEDVKEDVKDALVLEKISADSNLRNKAWVKIRKKYNLKIEDSAIEKIYKNTIKDLEK